ncbi:MAG: pitrilysin family protein [Pseudomonadota bacterium]|nr:pitrilysin family protein [Pseudomonadota bacterium]
MHCSTALPLIFACALAAAPTAAATVGADRTDPVARSGEAQQSLQVVDIPYEKTVLPNGLTLIVNEDHTTPVVSVGIWYHVGSAHETEGRTGFAHLFEHLFFNGSQNANTDWFESMNAVGATGMNGTTSYDRTNYYQTVPSNALDRTLWLEGDRMANLLPVVDQARLDEQRRVVQNEKRQRENNPLALAPDMIAAATYPEGHPYSWSPIGSMEDLEAATLEDVHAFFNRWYGAGNAVLVLSGDITAADAREKVERYFGHVPGGPVVGQAREQIAPMRGESRGVLEARIAYPVVIKVWNAPGWASQDAQLLQLVASVLASGPNSRFQTRLVRELELATEVNATAQTLELGSQMIISASGRPGVTHAQLEAALDAEIERFIAEGPTDEELERVKFGYYASSVRGLTSTMNKATLLGESELYGGSPDFHRTRLEMVYGATPASVQDVARRWLTDGSYVLEIRPTPEFQSAEASADLTTPPPIGEPASFSLPPLQHATLSNGIRVALAERHDVPTVGLTMAFDVGSLPDRDPASVGLSVAYGMTTMGTESLTDLEIAARRDELGAGISWQGGQEVTRYGLNALKLTLEESLDLWVDILRHPTFPAKEWERLRAIYAAQYEESLKTPEGKLGLVLPALVYGPDHPYAARLTPEVAARLTTEDFRRFYTQWIRPDLASIMVGGDTTLEEIVPLLESRLGDWRASAGDAPVRPELPAPVRPTGVRVVLVDHPGAESSIIAAGQLGPTRNDPDYEALSVVNGIVGGSFVSRLNMNLREEKGWSYGAKSSLDAGARLGTVGTSATVQTDKTADSMREMDREMREIGSSRPPTPAEIQSARNQMLLGLPATLQGTSGALGMYATVQDNGLPEDYWNTYVQRVQALTPEEIEAAAARLYDPATMTWVVAGDLSKIEADIRALNLGTVEVVDVQGRRIR